MVRINLVDLSAKATRSQITTSGKVANTKFWTWLDSVVYLAQEVLLHIPNYGEYVTRTGIFTKTYSNSFPTASSAERSETVWVPFPSPFSEVPSVGVTITSLDLSKNAPGLRVLVTK